MDPIRMKYVGNLEFRLRNEEICDLCKIPSIV
jgi:hypothetical protein